MWGVLLIGGLILLLVGLIYVAPTLASRSYESDDPGSRLEAEEVVIEENLEIPTEERREEKDDGPTPAYITTPEAVKAIYMSQCVVGTPNFRADLVELIDETELNSVIIDLKDYTGKLAFETDHPALQASISDECGARDMRSFVELLHSKNIYVIGRITVFQDPYYSSAHPELAVKKASNGAVWEDFKGLSFIDVGARPFWEYIVTLSKEARQLGFDELNYDYIRFPSDGPMKDIHFSWSVAKGKTKPEALEEFFAYLYNEMKPTGVALSADLFGMTTTNTDDLGIGQQLERALPYFDYIAPMVYPSHYPDGWNGFANPDNYPYEVIKVAMDEAVRRTVAIETPVETLNGEPIYEEREVSTGTSTPPKTERVFTGMYTKESYSKYKMRPWIQDFDYGGDYDVAEVKAQIQATYDTGLNSWMLWAPSNRYTGGALGPQK